MNRGMSQDEEPPHSRPQVLNHEASTRVQRMSHRAPSKSREQMVESLKKQHKSSKTGGQLVETPRKPPAGGHAHASLEISVNLLQGQGLAAKDYSLITGEATSSDPYVIISILTTDAELEIGTTKTCLQTLNPFWNQTLTKTFPPGTFKTDQYILKLAIWDYDLCKEDDLMGIVKIPMTVETVNREVSWYEVPAHSAHKATGKIEMAIQTNMQYSMAAFLPGSPIVEEEDPVATPTAGRTEAAAASLYDAGAAFTMGATSAVGAMTNATSSAAATMLGALTVVPGSSSHAKKGAKKEEENEDDYDYIYGEEESVLQIKITAHQGDGLVAKDRNVLGQKVTSDPYVVAELWPLGIPAEDDRKARDHYPTITLGRSVCIRKNLSPVWEHSFDMFTLPLEQVDMEEAQLRLRIMDDDFGMKEDDPMGNVDIYLQPKKHLQVDQKWYHVSATSCTRASGRVQVSLDSLPTTHRPVIGKTKKKKPVVSLPPLDTASEHEARPSLGKVDEMAASMPARFFDEDKEDNDRGTGISPLRADRDRARVRSSRTGRRSGRHSDKRRSGGSGMDESSKRRSRRESALRRSAKPSRRHTVTSPHVERKDKDRKDSKARSRSHTGTRDDGGLQTTQQNRAQREKEHRRREESSSRRRERKSQRASSTLDADKEVRRREESSSKRRERRSERESGDVDAAKDHRRREESSSRRRERKSEREPGDLNASKEFSRRGESSSRRRERRSERAVDASGRSRSTRLHDSSRGDDKRKHEKREKSKRASERHREKDRSRRARSESVPARKGESEKHARESKLGMSESAYHSTRDMTKDDSRRSTSHGRNKAGRKSGTRRDSKGEGKDHQRRRTHSTSERHHSERKKDNQQPEEVHATKEEQVETEKESCGEKQPSAETVSPTKNYGGALAGFGALTKTKSLPKQGGDQQLVVGKSQTSDDVVERPPSLTAEKRATTEPSSPTSPPNYTGMLKGFGAVAQSMKNRST